MTCRNTCRNRKGNSLSYTFVTLSMLILFDGYNFTHEKACCSYSFYQPRSNYHNGVISIASSKFRCFSSNFLRNEITFRLNVLWMLFGITKDWKKKQRRKSLHFALSQRGNHATRYSDSWCGFPTLSASEHVLFEIVGFRIVTLSRGNFPSNLASVTHSWHIRRWSNLLIEMCQLGEIN